MHLLEIAGFDPGAAAEIRRFRRRRGRSDEAREAFLGLGDDSMAPAAATSMPGAR
jgi:hypothetical protein